MIKVNVYTDESGEDAGYAIDGEDCLYPFPVDPEYPHATTALVVLKDKEYGKLGGMSLRDAIRYYSLTGYILFDDNLNVVEEIYETIH